MIVAALLASAVAIVAGPPDRALAHKLWMRGLDKEAVFAFDSADALYTAATIADVEFLPAYLDRLRLSRRLGSPIPVVKHTAARTDLKAGFKRCVISVMRTMDDSSPSWIDEFRAMRDAQGLTPCVALGLARALQQQPTSRRTPSREELELARTAANAFPMQRDVIYPLFHALSRAERHAELRTTALGFASHAQHILHRQAAESHALRASIALADTAAALAAFESMRALALRDGRAWVIHECLDYGTPLAGAFSSRDVIEGFKAEQHRILTAANARALLASAMLSEAMPMVEAGRMKEALRLAEPYAKYVEENELVLLEIRLRHAQGRALVRSGRPAEAIPLLLKSRAAAVRVHSVQFIAEAEHQLTHAYEGLKDWPKAARQAERFILAARETPDDAIRVVSYYDAAAIHWKAGWHAAADSLSRLMVEAIEREGSHYVFAAEYFERIGDLGRAMTYLRRASVRSANGELTDANFLYAGLTRMHLALGNTDSALVTATQHDALPWTFDELLVPKVMIARGEPARAISDMLRWIAFQADRGNVRGQVKALVSLADMLVEVRPEESMVVAREAELLARRNAFTLETLVAMRARGRAATMRGSPDAVATLESARDMARTHPDAEQAILTDVALGDAYAATGRGSAALSAYRNAISRIETTGRSVTDDVTLARFRAARTHAFNGAVRMALAVPRSEAARASAVLALSARKKASKGAGSGGVAALQRALGSSEAIVDYLVVDSSIIATVVTRSAATLHTMPLRPDDVLSMARRLTRPFTAVIDGRVDLARAPFDVPMARRLYDGLLGPLAGSLQGIREITIVPDTPLHAVPFDALVVSAGRDTIYVIDRFATHYALAALPPAVSHERQQTGPLLLVVGDAPGATVERDMLRRAWKGPVEVLYGVRGTETSLLQRASSGGVLHVASHAHSNDVDPLASHLSLARDSINDGLLHYAEIARVRNRYALVVLNACDTFAGKLLAGSGFMSLARAFLVGGSNAVVATQWPVGASSAEVTRRFYEALGGGRSATEALHQAKLALRRDASTAHPFYWASHVLLESR